MFCANKEQEPVEQPDDGEVQTWKRSVQLKCHRWI